MLQAARGKARKVAEERVKEQLKAQRDDELKYEVHVRCAYITSESCALWFRKYRPKVFTEADWKRPLDAEAQKYSDAVHNTRYMLIASVVFFFAGSNLISKRRHLLRPRRRRKWRGRSARLRISSQRARLILTWYVATTASCAFCFRSCAGSTLLSWSHLLLINMVGMKSSPVYYCSDRLICPAAL